MYNVSACFVAEFGNFGVELRIFVLNLGNRLWFGKKKELKVNWCRKCSVAAVFLVWGPLVCNFAYLHRTLYM